MKYFNFIDNPILKIISFCIFISVLSDLNIFAQNAVIEQIVEDIASKSDNDDADYTSLVEDLTYYLSNPLNLNTADLENLEKLQFLNELQIENLLNYIASKGGMKTIYELQLIESFDIETIRKMLPFVNVIEIKQEEKLKTDKVIRYGNHRLLAETKFLIQDQKGYTPEIDISGNSSLATRYQGNNMKYLLRYRFNYKNKIFAGITTEKDPGEKLSFNKNLYGFDYYSFHFQIKDLGIIKNLAVGDFQVKFGQGLILWTGFGMGKSSNVLNIRKKGQGLRFYSSTDENNFMRGIGTTLKFGKFDYTLFFSRKKIDANLNQADTIENEEEISSLQNSGYHRTLSELEDRKVVDETIFGSKIGLSLKHFKMGINFVAYQFNYDMLKSDKPFKYYDFTAKQNYNLSFDYYYNYKKVSLFGETAIGKNGGIAIQNGFVCFIVPQLSFSLLHRYYQKEYQAYYSNSFSENTKISNENGIYYGLEFHPVRRITLKAYVDSYQFPWLKYGVDAPSQGNEYFVQANFSLNKNVDMYFKWRNESKATNIFSDNKNLNILENEKKESYRFHISYRISELVSLRNRIEISHFQQKENNQKGFMIYQDINFDLKRIPLSLYFRYAVFDATYDARIYSYENDLLYNFSVPVYSGKGSRFYAMIKYKATDDIELRFRFSQFFYPEQETIGTALDEIKGDMKSEIKLQFVMRL